MAIPKSDKNRAAAELIFGIPKTGGILDSAERLFGDLGRWWEGDGSLAIVAYILGSWWERAIDLEVRPDEPPRPSSEALDWSLLAGALEEGLICHGIDPSPVIDYMITLEQFRAGVESVDEHLLDRLRRRVFTVVTRVDLMVEKQRAKRPPETALPVEQAVTVPGAAGQSINGHHSPASEWSREMSMAEAGRLLGGPDSDDGARKHLKVLLGEREDVIRSRTQRKHRFRLDWVREIEPASVEDFRSDLRRRSGV